MNAEGNQEYWPGWQLKELRGVISNHGPEARADARVRQKWKSKKRVLQIIAEHQPDLAFGVSRIKLSQTKVNTLFDSITRDCGGKLMQSNHNFLVDGLLAGTTQLGWKIPIPGKMVTLPRESSPFTPAKFMALAELSTLHDRFMETVYDSDFYGAGETYLGKLKSSQVSLAQLQAGQIVLSAIMNGALLNKAALHALGQGIDSLVVEDGRVWLYLDAILGSKNKTRILRCWYPDPLTSLLLIKWKQRKIPWPGVSLSGKNNPLYLYLRSLGGSFYSLTLAELIRAAKTRFGLSHYPFLLTYAEKIGLAPSLPPTAWARLRKNLVKGEEKLKKRKPLAVPSCRVLDRKKMKGTVDSLPDQLIKFRKLQRILGKRAKEKETQIAQVKKNIKTFLGNSAELCPLLFALAEWSLAMLQSSATRAKIKRSSMSTYLSTIGRDLVIKGTECNPAKMDNGSLVDLYDDVIESGKNSLTRQRRAARLKEFHHFMMDRYESIVDVEIDDIGGVTRRVNCDILTSKEFLRARQLLATDSSDDRRLKTIQSLIFTLGFRCGLRRTEILGLQVKDLQDGTGLASGDILANVKPELLIRNNVFRTIKSQKSIRRIPLHLLLTPQELDWLLGWKRERLNETTGKNKGNELLFCRRSTGRIMLDPKSVIDPVQRAMRNVSGENGLTFHNLRHSLITFLLLALISDHWPEAIISVEWQLDFPWLTRAGGITLSQELLRSPNNDFSRRYLYAVSQLCGHLDPDETMATYLHLLDYLLGLSLSKHQTPLTREQERQFLGMTEGYLRQYRNYHGLKGRITFTDILKVKAKKWQKRWADPILKTMREPTLIAPQLTSSTPSWPSPFLLYDVMRAAFNKMPANILSKRFDYPEDVMQGWLTTAKSLAAIKTGRGKTRLVPMTQGGESDSFLARYPNLPSYCPARPLVLQNVNDAERIYNSVLTLYEDDPNLVRAGLHIYMHHATLSAPNLLIPHDHDKKSFIMFLHRIAIAMRRIHITVWPNDTTPEMEQRRYWRTFFGLPLKNIHIERQKRNNPSQAPYGRPKIIMTKKETPSLVLRENVKNGRGGPATSVKFGLFMAAVYLGGLPLQEAADIGSKVGGL